MRLQPPLVKRSWSLSGFLSPGKGGAGPPPAASLPAMMTPSCCPHRSSLTFKGSEKFLGARLWEQTSTPGFQRCRWQPDPLPAAFRSLAIMLCPHRPESALWSPGLGNPELAPEPEERTPAPILVRDRMNGLAPDPFSGLHGSGPPPPRPHRDASAESDRRSAAGVGSPFCHAQGHRHLSVQKTNSVKVIINHLF